MKKKKKFSQSISIKLNQHDPLPSEPSTPMHQEQNTLYSTLLHSTPLLSPTQRSLTRYNMRQVTLKATHSLSWKFISTD